MSEIEKSLSHFSTFRFTDDYWLLPLEERAAMHGEWEHHDARSKDR